MNEPKLTGKTRFRFHKRLFREPFLVLQLQFGVMVTEYNCGYVDTQDKTWWRDAVFTDLTTDCPVVE